MGMWSGPLLCDRLSVPCQGQVGPAGGGAACGLVHVRTLAYPQWFKPGTKRPVWTKFRTRGAASGLSHMDSSPQKSPDRISTGRLFDVRCLTPLMENSKLFCGGEGLAHNHLRVRLNANEPFRSRTSPRGATTTTATRATPASSARLALCFSHFVF
jgi:hypothetical protein